MHPESRPHVRPRVQPPEDRAPVLLEDEVAALVAARTADAGSASRGIRILGGFGSGKTTAIEWLGRSASIAADSALLDEPEFGELAAAWRGHRLVVFTALDGAGEPAGVPRSKTYRLCPWTSDDWLEYLMQLGGREICRAILPRLQAMATTDRRGVLANPELCGATIDQLVRDERLDCLDEALLRKTREVSAPRLRRVTRSCLLRLWTRHLRPAPMMRLPARLGRDGIELPRILCHREVQALIVGDHLAHDLEGNRLRRCWERPWNRTVIREAGSRLARSPVGLEHARILAATCNDEAAPRLASVLCAADPSWCPAPNSLRNLSEAMLRGARWFGVQLRGVDLLLADLANAELRRAYLRHANVRFARLQRADLAGADLRHADFTGARLGGANLSRADGYAASFRRADLTGADLGDARLRRADLRTATIDGADLRNANLEDTDLGGLRLDLAALAGARFARARMPRCNLEAVVLERPDFSGCDASNALFTGSRFTDARFCDADLRGAGLADVRWPGADLRDADLRGASFHAGSSRSGLVGSDIPGEGSRTGFYTDEFFEQEYQAPEDIRKADLRRADLRGAKLDGVDFYLVDLRGASYTRDQEEQLRHTNAIL